MSKELIVPVYDSITNSVFESQVAKPLSERYPEYSQIIIVSFEVKEIENNIAEKLQASYPALKFILYKRCRFFGRFSLLPCVIKLRRLVKKYKNVDFLARGPQAGLIAYWTRMGKPGQLIIQARGLLAQEYLYVNQQKESIENSIIQKILYFIKTGFVKLRAQQYYRLERYVYTLDNSTIETVSDALKEYLIKEYKACKNTIYRATKDLPEQITIEQKNLWRTEIRLDLGINTTQKVYCYNGSAKAWQCVQETVDFFKQLDYVNNFLLLLTPEPEIFKDLLIRAGIQSNSYAIKSVQPSDLFKYLAACDYGIVFRKPHIINWVSRPTKILEYQAVNLPIVHNNTIAMLRNNNY